jgi:hypothetical protein
VSITMYSAAPNFSDPLSDVSSLLVPGRNGISIVGLDNADRWNVDQRFPEVLLGCENWQLVRSTLGERVVVVRETGVEGGDGVVRSGLWIVFGSWVLHWFSMKLLVST